MVHLDVREDIICGYNCRKETAPSVFTSLTRMTLFDLYHLNQTRITKYAITEYDQGRTRRWAVGWSLTNMILPDSKSSVSELVNN